MKYSITKRFTLVFTIIIAAVVLFTCVMNGAFLGRFYEIEKRGAIIRCYDMIAADYSDTDTIGDYCLANNLKYTIADNSLCTIATNVRDEDRMIAMLFGMIMDMEEDNTEIIYSTASYSVSKFHDKRKDDDMLQLTGVLDDGCYVMIQSPIESIELAVAISNRFYLIIGLIAIAVSILAIFLITRRLTAQVVDLSKVAERMADLDFSVKYTSGGEDEIGKLGESFNRMSENLEQAMSELKTANIKLAKDVEEKTQIDEMRREFLSNVSHELKTPIALIQGYAEGLKEMDLDKEGQDMYLDVIADEAVKMNRLVMQLMNLEQIESGNDSLDMTCFDIKEVIGGVLMASQLMLEQAGATVIFDKEEPCMVWADEFKIEQVITNYITNAIHHLDKEKVIEITCTEENGKVTLTVFNTGEPIPEESLDKIWNKFYKVDKARTRSYGGTGIGLSIVKAIADAHGQECRAQNYENGVAFSFTLDAK